MKGKIYLVVLTIILLIGNCGKVEKERTMINQIANTPNEIRPLLPGMDIPDQNKDLNRMIENKYSILIFYRGGWCPYCNLHFGELASIQNDLMELGYNVVAISPDLSENTVLTRQKHNLKYDLYSDTSMEVTRSYGLAYKVDDETIHKYKKYDLDIEKASGQTHHLLPVPAVYIISNEGIVLFQYVNPNYKVRLKPELLLEAARLLIGNKT